MKYKEGTDLLVEGDEFGESLSAGINADKMAKIFWVFSNLYRAPVDSITREITSNSVDANRDSGSSEPVIIKFSQDTGGDYVSFIDNGLGLTPVQMRDVYMQYGTSTKENDEGAIGFYGLGSKSVLSYRDDFHIITKAEGIKYHYLYHKGERGIPVCELLSQEDCTESGTEVKIYIKNGYDLSQFKRACISQLSYFDNVYVENNSSFNNKYEILEGKHFKVNIHQQPLNEMHIAFGRCTYPIDWNKVGMTSSHYSYPVAIKVAIGEVRPTPSREDLEYTKETIELIRERIKLVVSELNEIYESQIQYSNDLAVLGKENKPYVILGDGNFQMPFHHNTKPPVIFKDFPEFKVYGNLSRLKKYFEFDESYLSAGKTCKLKGYKVPDFVSGLIHRTPYVSNYMIYRKNADRLELNKNRFISQINNVLFIKPKSLSKREFIKFAKDDFMGLGLKLSKKEFKEKLNAFRKFIIGYVNERSKSYKDVVVTQEFLDSLKSSRQKDKTKINVKEVFGGYRETSYDKIAELYEVLILPAFNEDETAVKPFYYILNKYKSRYDGRARSKDKFQIYSVAKPIYEKLQKMDNCFTLEEFKERHRNLINKAYTAIIINKFISEHGDVIDHLSKYCPILAQYNEELLKYTKDQHSELENITYKGIVNPDAEDLMERIKLYCQKASIFKHVSYDIPNGEIEKQMKILGIKPYRSYIKQLELEFNKQPKEKNEQLGNQEEESGEYSSDSIQESNVNYILTE